MTQPRTARRHHGRVEAHPAETGRLRLLQLSATNAVTLERDRRLLLCGLVVSGVVRGREAHGAGDAPTLDLVGGGTAPGADPRQPRAPHTPPVPDTGLEASRQGCPHRVKPHPPRNALRDVGCASAAGPPATSSHGAGWTHAAEPRPQGAARTATFRARAKATATRWPREGRPFPHGPNTLRTRPAAPASRDSSDSPTGRRGTRA